MSIFSNVPARLADTVLSSPVMSIVVNFNWVESLNHYEAEGTDILDGEIFILTQSTSCPSLWHFDCIIIECDCEACHISSDPMRLGTGNRGEIIEIALNEISARIAESVAVNEPTLQYHVTVTLEN